MNKFLIFYQELFHVSLGWIVDIFRFFSKEWETEITFPDSIDRFYA